MALRKTFPLDTDPGYGFEWLRLLLEAAPLQPGVLAAGDFKVTVAAAGGNRVDVAAGIALTRGALAPAELGLARGLYLQANDATIANAVTFAPGDAQPRLDQVYLKINDSADQGDGSNVPAFGIAKGVPVAGTTLDNAYTNGSAVALPANAVRLADRLVPAGSNTLVATDLRDRRARARGAYRLIKRTANAGGTNDYTVATTGVSYVDSVNLNPRIECTGRHLEVKASVDAFHSAAGTPLVQLAPLLDGSVQDTAAASAWQRMISGSGAENRVDSVYTFTPAAGSHRIGLGFGVTTAGTLSLVARPTTGLLFWVTEILRDDADNN